MSSVWQKVGLTKKKKPKRKSKDKAAEDWGIKAFGAKGRKDKHHDHKSDCYADVLLLVQMNEVDKDDSFSLANKRVIHIPDEVFALTHLVSLNLVANCLERLPKHISMLSSLTILNVRRHNLHLLA